MSDVSGQLLNLGAGFPLTQELAGGYCAHHPAAACTERAVGK